MKVQEYNRDHARQVLDKWRAKKVLPTLSPEYDAIKLELTKLYEQAKVKLVILIGKSILPMFSSGYIYMNIFLIIPGLT